MKERSIAHHHAEIVGNNGDTRVKLYSTDDLGNVWGEEFESVKRANSVLGRRQFGLNLLSTSIATAAYSLPLVLELKVVKRNKTVRALTGLAVMGLGKGFLDWRQGINDMAFETQGRIRALDEAKKRKI